MAQAQATILQEINGLYVAAYGRAADGPGIDFWASFLGVSTSAAATTVITVPQQMALGAAFVNTQNTYFLTQYPVAMSDLAFVQAIYVNIGGNTGDATGVQFWFNQLQLAEAANGGNVTAARASIMGQFVFNLLSIDLTVGAAALGLNATDYAAAVARQVEMQNKVTVSQYYADESRLPGVGGAANVLLVTATGTPAFVAAQQVANAVTNNPASVTTVEAAIAAAVAAGSLATITALPPGAPFFATTFTLTTGTDVFTATQNNTLVVGTNATFTAGDQIAGNGFITTVTLNDAGVGGTYIPTAVAGATVSGVQTLNVNTAEAVTINTASGTQGWAGLTTLNVLANVTGSTAGSAVSAAATTAINFTLNGAGFGGGLVTTGPIVIAGGSVDTVVLTDNNLMPLTTAVFNTVVVNGLAGTTSVSVSESAPVVAGSTFGGVADGLVLINGTGLTTVSLTNFGTGSTITNGATAATGTLANLTLSGSPGATLGITNASKTVALNLTGFTGGLITDVNNEITTLNVAVTGTTALALADAGLKTVGITGTGALTWDTTNGGTQAQAMVITDADTGAQKLTLNALSSFNGTGSGVDTITLNAANLSTGGIVGGSAAGNTIVLNFLGTGAVIVLGPLTNFSTLNFVAGVSGGVYSLPTANTVNTFNIAANPVLATAVTNLVGGTALTVNEAGGDTSTFTTLYAGNGAVGGVGSATVNLGTGTAGFFTSAGFNFGDAAGNAVGTLAIVSSGAATTFNLITALDTAFAGLGANLTGISALTITGTTAVRIGAGGWNDGVTSLVITNNVTGTNTSAFGLTDPNLGSLVITGTATGATTVTITDTTVGGFAFFDTAAAAVTFTPTFAAAGPTVFTVTDTSAAILSVTGFTDTNLTTATFNNLGAATLAETTAITSAGAAFATVNFTGTGAETFAGFTSNYVGTTLAPFTINDSDSGLVTVTALIESGAGNVTINNSGGLLTITTATISGGAGATDTVNNTGVGGITISNDVNTDAVMVFNNTGTGTLKDVMTTTRDANLTTVNITGTGPEVLTLFHSTVATAITQVGNANVTLTDGNSSAGDAINLNNGNDIVTITNNTAISITVGNGGTGVADAINLGAGHGAGTSPVIFNAANGGTFVASAVAGVVTGAGIYTISGVAANAAPAYDTIAFANSAVNTTVFNEGPVASIALGIAGAHTTAGFNEFSITGTTTEFIFENTGTAATSELVAIAAGTTHTINVGTTAAPAVEPVGLSGVNNGGLLFVQLV